MSFHKQSPPREQIGIQYYCCVFKTFSSPPHCVKMFLIHTFSFYGNLMVQSMAVSSQMFLCGERQLCSPISSMYHEELNSNRCNLIKTLQDVFPSLHTCLRAQQKQSYKLTLGISNAYLHSQVNIFMKLQIGRAHV